MSAAASSGESDQAPPLPEPVLAVGLTGHRRAHPSFPKDPAALGQAIERLFELMERCARETRLHRHENAQVRFGLVTLLADGTDQLGAEAALARGWSLAAPLPFGERLNTAIGSGPRDAADARRMLAGEAPLDPDTAERAAILRDMTGRARTFELADGDPALERDFLAALDNPGAGELQSGFTHAASARYRLAGRVLIEQCDILVAVWDGKSTLNPGGTGDTARRALAAGVPVLWIDPADPARLRFVTLPEELQSRGEAPEPAAHEPAIRALVEAAIALPPPPGRERHAGLAAIAPALWRASSSRASHAYRRLETLFGEASWRAKFRSLGQRYERPDEVGQGEFAGLLEAACALADEGTQLREEISRHALARFAWTNGIASQMADRYRSGMVVNFLLGALAIISGVLYLPLVDTSQKWIFAAIELGFLLAIVANTVSGQRLRLHGRWLETRRTAEYLRHGALLFVAGVARPIGNWPAALRGQWPEWYARMTVRGMGLPEARVDAQYLHRAAQALLDHLVSPQLAYHRSKSGRLHRAHHAIEHLAERLFAVAILAVAAYLALSAAAGLGLVEGDLVKKLAKWFTVIAVALPTTGGALAAIGYFGDFDRFADISQATAQRLEELRQRIEVFLGLPDESKSYARFADLARTADAIAFGEIQAWQAVFSGKRITVPA